MKTSTVSRGRTTSTRPLSSNGNGEPSTEVKKSELVRLERMLVEVPVTSETGLIVHEFSEKSRKEMLDKHMKKARKGREAKDPLQDFKYSLYRMPGKRFAFGFPARGFKGCFVKAANDVELMKTEMKRAIRVLGNGDEEFDVNALIEIEAEPLPKEIWTKWDHEYEKDLVDYHKLGISMREDVVRLENGVADIRFRAYYPKWHAKVKVMFNSRVLSKEQLLALIDAAGFGVGIGEWRPGAPKSETGQYGCYVVDVSKPIVFKEFKSAPIISE